MLRNLSQRLQMLKVAPVLLPKPAIYSMISGDVIASKRFQRSFGNEMAEPDKYDGTMDEINKIMMKRIGLEPGYQPIQKSREHLLKYQPKPENLPPRSMQDSFSSALLPLSADKQLQDKYITVLGSIRLGRLLEDMDLFAVWSCHKHLHIPDLPEGVDLPYTFVTILVDKIQFSGMPTTATEDVRLSGHVSFVGTSSVEVVVWLEQKENGVYKRITRALFLMAARNATNTGPAPVNKIVASNEREKKIISDGETRRKRRQIIQQKSIFKVEPNDFEQSMMYEIFSRTTPKTSMTLNKHILPPNCTWMADTMVVNTIRSYPEHRNAHNKVFGGFLMRNSLEISHLNACLYSKNRPLLQCMSDITFEKPVSVDSFIRLTCYVIYTEMNYMQLLAIADVIGDDFNDIVTSNTFYFTYKSPDIVRQVLPKTYQEMLWYIHGRRKFRYAMDLEKIEVK